MFLTKNPERYAELEQMAMLYRMKNFWYGTTITCQDDAKRIDSLPAFAQRFVSIEPMMGPVDLEAASLRKVHWIIAGAETGNRPGKTAPQKEWLEGLVGYAYKYSIPILLKDSRELREVWGNELIQEFPKGLEPMQPTYIPRCRECDHAETTAQGRRGTAYACGIGWEGVCDRGARSIPGRYTRTSPPWCPKRKEGKAE